MALGVCLLELLAVAGWGAETMGKNHLALVLCE